jgi:hypothetical protein
LENPVPNQTPYVVVPRYRIDGFDVITYSYETGHESDHCFGCLAGTCVQRVERCKDWRDTVVTHAVWKELS